MTTGPRFNLRFTAGGDEQYRALTPWISTGSIASFKVSITGSGSGVRCPVAHQVAQTRSSDDLPWTSAEYEPPFGADVSVGTARWTTIGVKSDDD